MSPALATDHGRNGPDAAGRAASLAWKVVPSPNGSSIRHDNQFAGVACPSASACIAVGDSSPQSLAERWNGSRWSILATPQLPTLALLEGVSCLSARDCTAVGTQQSPLLTLVETWNGTKWTVVPSPNVASRYNYLDSVSCVSARACMAVGSISPISPYARSKTLIESWNGTAWRILPSPHIPPANSYDELYGVSCVSAEDCTAVGVRGGGDVPLIESWDGTAWKVVPSPTGPHAEGFLDGVVCLSASACTAVGSLSNDKSLGTKALVETWNGIAWKVVRTAHTGPTSAFNEFSSISCISVRDCTAVGDFWYDHHHHEVAKTLVEAWNGTAWKVVPSPNSATPATLNHLVGVSCASAASCSAVGDFGGAHRTRTLAELGTPAA